MALDHGPLASGERWLLNWAGVCLILGLGVAFICGYHAGFLRLNTLATAHPDWVWSCLTLLGDERMALALAVLFCWHRPRLLWALILAGLLATGTSRGLKELIDAARPPAILPVDAFHLIGPALTHASFPSGHSITAAVLGGVFIAHTRWIEIRLLLLVLAVLVGLSRVAVGVHWPLDVLSGLMVGALAAWVGGRLAGRWPSPAGWLGIHLAVASLAVLAAVSLLIDGGGYPAAAWFGRLIAIIILASVALRYLRIPAMGSLH
ncbi:phosphatase PAP2 family protein [Caldichromatium japonicum]|uniref:undecaprenyl-diphosphate phosphatase n=2 Tax=Caldichromatium japonicum TaxID=2699430 RepID=A0A6G7VGI8_9GAMM|nr:phosphatase PAP2 family protein [Caldichromatium japonicum]